MTETKDSNSFQVAAYDRIRQDIILCKLAPGQKLSARLLEESLGLGRTPVREALVRLGQEGLVSTIPQSGTYVSKISMQSAENALYMREHLECSVAMECCARIDGQEGLVSTIPQSGTYVSKISMQSAENALYMREHLECSVAMECCARIDQTGCETLEGILALQDKALRNRDSAAFYVHDNAFHKELYHIAGRDQVWDWVQSCNTDLQRFRWLRTQVEELDWADIERQHIALYAAISNKDTHEAAYLTSAHLHLMSAEQDSVRAAFPCYFA